MTYYIFMTPVLLMIVAMILRLRALKKHDKVLYAFCQLRRDTMSLIREHNYDLCRQDYIALRDIEDGLSDTIHDYNMHKVYLFNFRKFSAALRRLKPQMNITSGERLRPEITRLRRSCGQVLILAFFTFTPFLKHEIAIKALRRTLIAIATLSGAYLRAKLRRRVEILSWVITAKTIYGSELSTQ